MAKTTVYAYYYLLLYWILFGRSNYFFIFKISKRAKVCSSESISLLSPFLTTISGNDGFNCDKNCILLLSIVVSLLYTNAQF